MASTDWLLAQQDKNASMDSLFSNYGKGGQQIVQGQDPQSLGAEITSRANTSDIEGENSSDPVGKVGNFIQRLAPDPQLKKMSEDYWAHSLGLLHIPDDQLQQYSDANDQYITQLAMGVTDGSGDGKSPFKIAEPDIKVYLGKRKLPEGVVIKPYKEFVRDGLMNLKNKISGQKQSVENINSRLRSSLEDRMSVNPMIGPANPANAVNDAKIKSSLNWLPGEGFMNRK